MDDAEERKETLVPIAVEMEVGDSVELFFKSLYGRCGRDCSLVLSSFRNGRCISESFFLEDIDSFVERGMSLGRETDVYFNINPMASGLPSGQRGTADDVRYVVAIGADIDVRNAVAHTETDIPETKEDAEEFLNTLKPRPSFVFDTGYGLDAIWILDEPILLDSDESHRKAERLVGDFGNHVMEEGRKRGWRLDNVFDLPRMLRFPGSMNFKVKGSPVEGSFLSTEGVSVTAEEIESKGIGRPVAMPAEAFVPPPDDGGWGEAERMCACRLVQMAMEDPSGVTEPLWHAFATNCAAVPGGRKLFHDVSAMDGRYEEGQCDRKFAYAFSAGKPCSCRYIATQLGFRCPEGGCGVRSPYLLCRLTGEERLDRLIASGLSPDNVFTEEVAAILFDVKVRNPMKYAFFKAKLREAGIDASDIDSIVSRQVPKNLPAVDDFTAASHSWLRTRSERAADHTPQEFFIDDYVVKGDSCSQIFGRTGNGKSFVVVDMMETIANPSVEEWHGHVVANHGKVLYLCGEGHGSIDDRMLAWEQHHGVSPTDDILISASGCDLDKVDGLGTVEAELDGRGFIPDIIFIDTLNRFMSGNENDASEMRAFLNNCKVLQTRYHAAVYVVTHTGKDPQKQDAARGSSALDAACDNIIKVSKSDNVVTMSFTKVKRGKAPEPLSLVLKDIPLEGVSDHHGDQISSAVCEDFDGGKIAGGAQLSGKQREALDAFREAMTQHGEEKNGKVCVSRDGLRSFLMDRYGWSSKRVSMELSLTAKDSDTRFLGKLVLRDRLVVKMGDLFTLAPGVETPAEDDFLCEEAVPL